MSNFDREEKSKKGPEQNIFKKKVSVANILAFLIICVLIAVPIFFSINRFEEVFNRENEVGKILITEISSGDADVYTDADGSYPDWIEIYNPSNVSVNLKGYYISDNVQNKQKFELPDKVLNSGEYLLIFASGKNKITQDEIHTNFKIDSAGEEIYLVEQTTEIQKVEVPKMPPQFSYGIDEEGEWLYLKPVTPKEKNGRGYENLSDYYVEDPIYNGVYINEYMSKGQSVFYDENGEFNDWFEIINLREDEVNLEGYFISDNLYNPTKWAFPNINLKSGQAIAVFADSKDINSDDNIHTNFCISPEEKLYLYDNDRVLIDIITIVETDQNVSYGRDKNNIENWVYFSVPTPGQENITKGYTQKKTANETLSDYLFISEVMPTLDNNFDGEDEHGDWIEIYNASENEINLAEFGLSDNKDDLGKWIFPSESKIAAGEYLLVFASKKNKVDEEGFLHTNFKLDAMNEEVFLTSSFGFIIDSLKPKYVHTGHSLGRKETKEVFIFRKPTPKTANSDNYFLGYTTPVVFSKPPGQYEEVFDLELTCKENDAKIYYTLDGSTPTSESIEYTLPIHIKNIMTVRAMARSNQKLKGEVVTHNYIIGKTHELPIVFISTDRENLYGDSGIISRPSRTNQVLANIEIVEADNAGSASFDAGIRIFGNTSRYAQQKSFAVELARQFGMPELRYPLFLDDLKTPDTFKSFVLRNGGSEEWNRTKLTDASLMSLSRLGMNVDAQAYRPAAIYINGDYYGLTNIREKLNRDYIETRYGVDGDLIKIIEPAPGKIYREVHGSKEDFEVLVKYIKQNDLNNYNVYKNVEKHLDIDNYIDTILAHILLGNKDSGNLKFWKPEIKEAKWRLFLFDLDRAAYYPSVNHFKTRTSVDGHGSGKSFDTSVLRGLLENDEFESKFSKRAIELIDTIYSPEFATAYYNYLAENIKAEMDRSLGEWWEYSYNRADPGSKYGAPPGSKKVAKKFVEFELDRHRNFFAKRQNYIYKYHKNFFNLSDKDIKKMREEIKEENGPSTQIYNEFISSGSIENAISLANTLETVLIY
jgi:hypothetical protein